MNTKETRQLRAQKLQEGIKQHFAKTKAITFGGQDHKPSDILGVIQKAIDATKDSAAKKAAYHAAVEAEVAAVAAMQPVALGVTTYIYLTYGNSSPALADFGLPPRTKRAASVETKAEALEKSRATREARGTKGKRQREEIVATSSTATQTDTAAKAASTNGTTSAAQAANGALNTAN